ncbi:hypothetical protein F5887DRAFT_930012 [Amanita rubescens]|nr:hypothetical protein F5887DRAFT_930012 [Amanita rubescens]
MGTWRTGRATVKWRVATQDWMREDNEEKKGQEELTSTNRGCKVVSWRREEKEREPLASIRGHLHLFRIKIPTKIQDEPGHPQNPQHAQPTPQEVYPGKIPATIASLLSFGNPFLKFPDQVGIEARVDSVIVDEATIEVDLGKGARVSEAEGPGSGVDHAVAGCWTSTRIMRSFSMLVLERTEEMVREATYEELIVDEKLVERTWVWGEE